MTPETHRILPWLSPHVSQGQRHCSTSGLKQQKIMTLVVRTRDAKNSSLYHPSIIFEYSLKTPSTIQVLSEISPNTRMILEYSRYPNEYLAPKTNRVHISNEDCNDIGNGVLVNDAYDGEKAGVLLWDCLFCLRKSVITIPESGASLPFISLRNKPGWNI